jgi:hypothetical protein
MHTFPWQPVGHEVDPPGLQAPLPLHTQGSDATPPTHAPGTQGKFAGFFPPHAPAPSQRPVPSQGICVVSHSLSGSVAAATAPHVPFTPLPFLAFVHAMQVAVQPVSQQTPSAQNPLVQPPAAAHDAPSPCLSAQTPALQNALETQSPSVLHEVRHAAALHW